MYLYVLGTDKHENTNFKSMNSIFKYFDERYKDVLDPTRVKYVVKRSVPANEDSQTLAVENSINQSNEDRVEVVIENENKAFEDDEDENLIDLGDNSAEPSQDVSGDTPLLEGDRGKGDNSVRNEL